MNEYVEKYLEQLQSILPSIEFKPHVQKKYTGYKYKYSPRGSSHHWLSFGIIHEPQLEYWFNIGAVKYLDDFEPIKEILLEINESKEAFKILEKKGQYFIKAGVLFNNADNEELEKGLNQILDAAKYALNELNGSGFLGIEKTKEIEPAKNAEENTIKCRACQTELEADDKFCSNCGEKVELASAPAIETGLFGLKKDDVIATKNIPEEKTEILSEEIKYNIEARYWTNRKYKKDGYRSTKDEWVPSIGGGNLVWCSYKSRKKPSLDKIKELIDYRIRHNRILEKGFEMDEQGWEGYRFSDEYEIDAPIKIEIQEIEEDKPYVSPHDEKLNVLRITFRVKTKKSFNGGLLDKTKYSKGHQMKFDFKYLTYDESFSNRDVLEILYDNFKIQREVEFKDWIKINGWEDLTIPEIIEINTINIRSYEEIYGEFYQY